MNLTETQTKLKQWFDYNFPKATSSQQLIGIGEEFGELCHAHLKLEQGIRGSPAELHMKARDAVGDMLVFIMNYCSLRGWKLEEIVGETVKEVVKRDWKMFPMNGTSS